MADTQTKKQTLDMSGKPYSRVLLMITAVAGAFATFLAGTMLATAYPTLMNHFNISTDTVQWLSTGFMLISGVMIPITAWLMNRFNSKWLYIIGMAIFLIGNIYCLCSHTFAMLLGGRLIAAVGVGVTTSLSQSILLYIFPPEKRGIVMGINGIAVGLAPAIGPTLSGWVVDNYGWRVIFMIVIVFVTIDLIAAFFFMKKVMPTADIKLDYLSAVLSILGFGSLLYGISKAGSLGWGNHEVVITIIVGIILIALFCWRQLQLDEPFLDIRLLSNWHFTLASIIGAIARVALVGVELVLPMYIQIVRGESAFHSGLILLPGAILMGLMSPIAGSLFDKMGAKKLVISGLIILTVGTMNFVALTPDTPIIEIIVLYAVRIVGISLAFMPVTTAGMNALPTDKINHGTAINNTFRQVAGSIGTAIFTTILTNTTNNMKPSTALLHSAPLAYKHQMINAALGGYRASFFAAMLVGLAGVIVALFLQKNAGLVKRNDANKGVK